MKHTHIWHTHALTPATAVLHVEPTSHVQKICHDMQTVENNIPLCLRHIVTITPELKQSLPETPAYADLYLKKKKDLPHSLFWHVM